MLCNYECFRKWTKYLTYLVSFAVVAVGITRLLNVFVIISVFEYILNAYVIECELQFVLKNFIFLRYYSGKAFYIKFIGFLCYSDSSPMYIAIATFCFVVAILYVVLGFTCLGSEREYYSSKTGNQIAYSSTPESSKR